MTLLYSPLQSRSGGPNSNLEEEHAATERFG